MNSYNKLEYEKKDLPKDLFKMSEDSFGEDYKDKFFEQYKLYLQEIDSLAKRRALANNFFLSINTGLLSLLVFLFNLETAALDVNGLWVLGGLTSGILFSITWYRIVSSYRQLSSAKWDIVNAIEKKLPIDLHETEWRWLGEGKDVKRYRPLTGVEQYVPMIFVGAYSLVAAISVTMVLYVQYWT